MVCLLQPTNQAPQPPGTPLARFPHVTRTRQGCPVDDDDDPSAVLGCTAFCRDIKAEVAGDGPADGAVVQLSRGVLAAGALPVLCWAGSGTGVSPLHATGPGLLPRPLRSQERRMHETTPCLGTPRALP